MPEYLIFAMEDELRSLHLDPNVTAQPFAPVSGLDGAVAVDFDYADQAVFVTQVKGRKISRYDVGPKQIRDFMVHENSTGA